MIYDQDLKKLQDALSRIAAAEDHWCDLMRGLFNHLYNKSKKINYNSTPSFRRKHGNANGADGISHIQIINKDNLIQDCCFIDGITIWEFSMDSKKIYSNK